MSLPRKVFSKNWQHAAIRIVTVEKESRHDNENQTYWIMSKTPPRLFKFYECLFDFRTTARDPTAKRERAKATGHRILASGRVASAFARTVIASDGNIGVAFNQRRPGYPGGLDHFGMMVNDIGGVLQKIKEKVPNRWRRETTAGSALR